MDAAARFSSLYQRQYDAVLRYALRRTDPETARDVAAETFLVAWRRLDVVPADDTRAAPWLYGVARRVLANAERARRRAENLNARLRQERPNLCPSDAAGVVADADQLTAALATLPETDQEALRLVGWEELDLAAAALAMGCSRGTMAVRLHRARRRLERALQVVTDGEPKPATGWPAPHRRITQETR
ncbi:MAG TPA: sigma-70 family RNA polymerase sigma factor [Streptosporangiaceae bacterium]|nr:sigma-70 family RNA polymerase sigma factor [Streptosporangiaceae bacterium]